MLARGALRDAGTATVAGRTVHRLTGTRTRTFGDVTVDAKIEYDVDPDSFAPVRARVEQPIPIGDDARFTSVLEFLTYERLPLNADTAALLEIQPVGTPKVRDDTLAAIHRRQRARREAKHHRRP
ncbi:MAG TPA: hypothetical protein VNT55_25580, partial [Baekduia sp.]|nr:hypothetical protein [Baekduia sp.]